jgi:hypothetical protein
MDISSCSLVHICKWIWTLDIALCIWFLKWQHEWCRWIWVMTIRIKNSGFVYMFNTVHWQMCGCCRWRILVMTTRIKNSRLMCFYLCSLTVVWKWPISMCLIICWTSSATECGRGRQHYSMCQHSPRVNTQRIFAFLHVLRMSLAGISQQKAICITSRELNIMNLRTQVGIWNSVIGLMHIHTCITTFYSLTRHNLPVIEWTLPETPICGIMKMHKEQQ